MISAVSGLDGLSRPSLSRPDLLRDNAYIGGSWLGGDHRIQVRNPATGMPIASVPDLGTKAAEAAVTAAADAAADWRALAAGARGAILRRWHDLVMTNIDDLARLMTAEQGKPLAEARGEVAYAASFLAWFAAEAQRAYGTIIPGHAVDKRLAVVKVPVGVVAAITPWNFPLAMITRKAGPALAAGCTMVLKPSDLTPLSALALAALADEAGVPPGVFNVVTGMPQEIGAVFTGDPRVRKLSFTGSTAVGKMLAARCMATVKRVSLELGGNAPLIVFDDAALETALDGTMQSKFRNAGQTCVCANRIYVQAGIYDAFVAGLEKRIGRLDVGDGAVAGTDIGPLIDERAVAKASAHVDDAKVRGATILVGGGDVAGPGTFFAPTLLRDVPRDALLCREETFGPVAGIIRFETESEAIGMANDTAAGLAAYLFTRDLSRSHRVSEALDYGMVGLNTGLISTEVAPFGGVKESGLGREGSQFGMDDYMDMKLICTAIETD